MSDQRGFLKDAEYWILLLFVTNLFFIFLAWLSASDTFPILVVIMLVFSLCVIGVGCLLERKQRNHQDELLRQFVFTPTVANEDMLLGVSHSRQIRSIQELGNKLRILQHEIDEKGEQAANYEEFIEAWVHEIKTPLSLTTLVLANRKDEMSPLVYQRFDHVRHTINAEVERILYYARLQSAHVNYQFEFVNLGTCCQEVLKEFTSIIEEKNIILEVEVVPMLVVTDMKTLQFILSQILSNALNYTKGEVGHVWMTTANLSDPQRNVVEIKDDGIGVAEQDLPFIFDKGFSGKHPERKKATGMGLYLVKKYCDLLGIDLQVESKKNDGFVIRLSFPLVDERLLTNHSDARIGC